MNPRQELKDLIQRLEAEIHAIKATPQNALRISDRRRELVRAVTLLDRLEATTTPIRKIRDRWQGLDPDAEFPAPTPETDPDMFGGLEQENREVFPDLVHEVFRRTCGRD